MSLLENFHFEAGVFKKGITVASWLNFLNSQVSRFPQVYLWRYAPLPSLPLFYQQMQRRHTFLARFEF